MIFNEKRAFYLDTSFFLDFNIFSSLSISKYPPLSLNWEGVFQKLGGGGGGGVNPPA